MYKTFIGVIPRKLLLKLVMMKIGIGLLLILCWEAKAEIYAQTVTLHHQNARLEDVLEEVRQQTGYSIFYDTEYLAKAKEVSLKLKNVPIEKSLERIFANQPFTYRIENGIIVITPKIAARSEVSDGASVEMILAYAEVRGRVVDSVGNPLQGASIRVIDADGQRTTLQTLSDRDGYFMLKNVPEDATLEITFVGYNKQEVKVMADVGSIILRAVQAELEEVEVVSTGYQRIPKERATGSFAQPLEHVFKSRISTDILSRLDGITSGLVFNANTGNTINGSYDINVRGRSTINANDQPLIVVDNFPYYGDLIDINPNDVAQVTVLKDAAAASIWGARAGNGVIVITTKNAKNNQRLRVSATANTTIADKADQYYNPFFLPSDAYIEIERFLFEKGKYDNDLNNTISFPVVSPATEIMANEHLSSQDSLSLINKLKKIDVREQNHRFFFTNPTLQQYALNISGGTDAATFYLAGGYDQSKLDLKFNNNQRISLNAVTTYNPLKRLTLSAGIHFTQRKDNRDGTFDAISQRTESYYPYIEYLNPDGGASPITYFYRQSYINQAANSGFLDWRFTPLDELGMTTDQANTLNVRVLTGLNYQIWEGLTADIKFQYQRLSNENKRLHPQNTFAARDLVNRFSAVDEAGQVISYHVPVGGYLERTFALQTAYNFRAQLNYARVFGKHRVDALAGYEINESTGSSDYYMLFGYDDALATHTPVNSSGYFQTNPSGMASLPSNAALSASVDRFRSTYFLGSYTFTDKYIFTASARIDGSNYFGVATNQKSVPLWSVGTKWNVDQETFYDITWLPKLSLTATYGHSGNLDRMTTGISTFLYINGARLTNLRYATLRSVGNPDLRWEKIGQAKFGFEFALTDHRISGSVEYFTKRGTDLIGTTTLAPSSGVINYRGNYSEMKGHGMDIQLQSTNIRGRFGWRTNLLLNTAFDRVTRYDISLNNTQMLAADGLNGKGVVPVVGKPVYSVYSLASAGLDPENGNPRGYIDGQVSQDYPALLSINPEELRYHGSGRPTVFGGLINTFDYGGLSLTVSLNFKGGYYFRRSSVNYATLFGNSILPHKDFLYRWQTPGDEAKTNVPSVVYPVDKGREDFYRYSSVLVEKGDHVRLQDILLGYKIPFRESRSGIRDIEVLASVSNVGIIWKATNINLDPDMIPSSPNTSYPRQVSLSIGLKANF